MKRKELKPNTMKKYTLFLILLGFGLMFHACENELDGVYSGRQAVYFPDFTETADSITYSFLGKPGETGSALLRVRLLGHAQPHAQQVALRVVQEKTTAVEGQHYEALPAFYEFPANAFEYDIPIVLLRHPDLDEGTKTLALELVDSEDLTVAFADKAQARIVFSNVVMKPDIWDNVLAPWFGDYSRIKHIVCMEIMGRPFPQTAEEFNLDRNMWRNWGWTTSNYFRDNIVMNTDVDPPTRILPWF